MALRNCGVINPENIEEYIAMDGYQALGKALTEMTPEQVIEEIKRSGLRGRGGAGFPTGRKWELAAMYHADQKYVACNADEGDPGAFMDRSVLEGDPHALLEAMAIAAYATGADHGFIYVRAEYPIAVKRLQIAIDQAQMCIRDRSKAIPSARRMQAASARVATATALTLPITVTQQSPALARPITKLNRSQQ